MKKNEFVKLIKETVSKEIRRTLREELKEILNPTDNSVDTFNENIRHGVDMHNHVQEDPTPHQKYSNDSMIDGILNETANGMRAYPTAGKQFTTQDAAGGRASLAAAMGMEVPQTSGPLSVQEMVPANRRGVAIPEAVSNALTKDYSQLMKHINKKK